MIRSFLPVRSHWRRAARIAIMAALCAGATACASGTGPGPLVLNEGQEGISSCMSNNPASGLLTWDTTVGYAEDMYWNKSSQPLTIEFVSLLDPHNLVLHGSVLYKMAHASHALPLSSAWAKEGEEVPLAEWRGRRLIPAAVMPPVGGPVDVNGSLSHKIDLYEIVVDISAATPAGGWALGEVVRYQAGGHAYTFEARTGLGIGTTGRLPTHSCDTQMQAIKAAFAAKK